MRTDRARTRTQGRHGRRVPRAACRALSLNRAFVYRDRARRRGEPSRRVRGVRPRPPLTLSVAEQDLLLGLLTSERFADVAPATIFATLLDEGRYHGSRSLRSTSRNASDRLL